MRSSWKSFWVVVVFAIGAVMTEGILLAGRDTQAPPTNVPVILGAGGVTAHRLSSKSWSFGYDHAQTSPDGSIATIDGIHDGVLFRKGKKFLTIRANHVQANTVSDDFTATGAVVISEVSGTAPRTFRTDLIIWTNVTKTLTLSHPSTITTGGSTLHVQNATVNFQTGKIHLGGIGGGVST